MKNDINHVGVAEKRELAKLLERQFDEAISQAVVMEKDLCSEAEQAAANKLGVQLIVEEIAKLDRQKALLVEKIGEMGFDFNSGRPRIATKYDGHTGDSVWKSHTLATKEAQRVLEATTNLSDLKSEKTCTLKKLWLTTSRQEIEKLVGNGKISVVLKAAPMKPQLAAQN